MKGIRLCYTDEIIMEKEGNRQYSLDKLKSYLEDSSLIQKEIYLYEDVVKEDGFIYERIEVVMIEDHKEALEEQAKEIFKQFDYFEFCESWSVIEEMALKYNIKMDVNK